MATWSDYMRTVRELDITIVALHVPAPFTPEGTYVSTRDES